MGEGTRKAMEAMTPTENTQGDRTAVRTGNNMTMFSSNTYSQLVNEHNQVIKNNWGGRS